MAICNGKAADGGPCPNQTLPSNDKCNRCAILYSNNHQHARQTAYKLGKWQQRMEALSQHDNLTSLNDEIGIARMTLEAVVERLIEPNDIIVHSHRISDMVSKIEKLVTSCHKLQKSSGSLLDKGAILQLAGKIIGIIQTHISDPNIIEAIANDIIAEVASIDCSEPVEQ